MTAQTTELLGKRALGVACTSDYVDWATELLVEGRLLLIREMEDAPGRILPMNGVMPD
ncbi:MAG: hypothetical protein AAFX93_04525 [Verrucomicrobiota bacterium]